MMDSQAATATALVKFPSDILLELTLHLELEDVLSFLSTCVSFRKLSESRFLWISVLERMQARRHPLACHVGEDISLLDLPDLQRIARHTQRVKKSWHRESARILSAVKSKRFTIVSDGADPHLILAVIPGTDLVILYSQETTQRVICCDIEGIGPAPSIYVGRIYRYSHYDQHGKHMLALADSENRLRVISVEYGHGKETKMRQVFFMNLEATCRTLFICKDVVGVLHYSDYESQLSILAINIVSNLSTTININLGHPINDRDFVTCYVLEERPFVITRGDKYEVYHCSPDILPYQDSLEVKDGETVEARFSRVAELDILQELHDDAIDVEIPLTKWSPRGLQATFVQYRRGYSESITTNIVFWPITNTPETFFCDNEVCADILLEGKVASYHRNMSDLSPDLVDASRSGVYTVIALDSSGSISHDSDTFTSLHVLHFAKDPPNIHSCRLELPFFIDLDDIFSLALDERRGVVYLSHVRGYLFAVPYA